MCGIAGLIQREPPADALARMLAALAHRGPDGEGTFDVEVAGWHVALGHRRLAIIDLEGGRQPMTNEDGAVVITYNGELYNFRELAARSKAHGHVFRTRSDTEAIIHHYEETHRDGLVELDGMFAFAIFDAARAELVLARDRIGIKPLYYASLPDGGIAFASELRALLEHPAISRRTAIDGLASYFFSDYVHPPHTIVEGARKLEPAHAIAWRDGTLETARPYWRIDAGEVDARARSFRSADAAEELWQRLGDAVERQLIADVPIGIFLSGGIDSSAIAVLAHARTPEHLQTFSMGFDDPRFDESPHARAVARHIGARHVEDTLSEARILGVVDDALAHLDEPLADPSFLPTFLLSRLAAEHVKVVLGGDGGDELFGGYPTYLAHAIAPAFELLPAALRERVIARAIARLPVRDRYQSLEWKLKRFFLRWDDAPVRRHLRWMSSTDLADVRALVPAAADRLPATIDATYPPIGDRLNRVAAIDLLTYLPGSVLTKVDRASMAHGLEVRPPFLDRSLVDWALAVPASQKLRGTRTKHLLRAAVAAHLPRDIVKRKKRGFAIPLARWLRGPLRPALEQAASSARLGASGILDRGVLARFRDEHLSERVDRSRTLWAAIVLDRWLSTVSTATMPRGDERRAPAGA